MEQKCFQERLKIDTGMTMEWKKEREEERMKEREKKREREKDRMKEGKEELKEDCNQKMMNGNLDFIREKEDTERKEEKRNKHEIHRSL